MENEKINIANENSEIIKTVGSTEIKSKNLTAKKLIGIAVAIVVCICAFIGMKGPTKKYELVKVEVNAYGEYLDGDISDMGDCYLKLKADDKVELKINGKSYKGTKRFLRFTDTEDLTGIYEISWEKEPEIVNGMKTGTTLLAIKEISTDGGKTYDVITCNTIFQVYGEIKGTDIEMTAWYYWDR